MKKQVETCKQFVELVHDLGGNGVKVRPNGLPKGVSTEKTLEQIGKALVECGKAAADAGVEIWVEVHGGGTQQPPNMKTIMEQCGHKSVGVTWNSNAHRHQGRVGEAGVRAAASRGSSRATSTSCTRTRPARTRTANCSGCSREAGYDRYTLIENGRTPPDVASGEDMLRYYKALWLELARG